MNPDQNKLQKGMREIIKQKVVSALCNEESVLQDRKKMYEELEDSDEEMIREARRTHHPEIQPAEVRLQNYQVKGFGRKFQQATAGVKSRDAELMA